MDVSLITLRAPVTLIDMITTTLLNHTSHNNTPTYHLTTPPQPPDHNPLTNPVMLHARDNFHLHWSPRATTFHTPQSVSTSSDHLEDIQSLRLIFIWRLLILIFQPITAIDKKLNIQVSFQPSIFSCTPHLSLILFIYLVSPHPLSSLFHPL